MIFALDWLPWVLFAVAYALLAIVWRIEMKALS